MQGAYRRLEQIKEDWRQNAYNSNVAGCRCCIYGTQKIYAALWYKNLTVRIDFSKKNAVCGETIELVETVTNKKRLPLPYINLKFQVNRAFRFEDGEENSVVSDNTYRNDIFH